MLKKHLRMRRRRRLEGRSNPAAAAAAAAAARSGEVEVEGQCGQTTLYIILEVFNHTLPLTQRFRRRRHAGYWWKRTPELTRGLRPAYAPELTKITISDMEV